MSTRLTRPEKCINVHCTFVHPSMPVLHVPHPDTAPELPGRCPLCRCVTMLELIPVQENDEALVEECKIAVQQKLDLDDLCPRCSHPVDECLCPEKASERDDAPVPKARAGTWECPYCNHVNTHLNRYCQECGELYGEAI